MKLPESEKYAVLRAVIEDAVKFENASVIIDEPHAAVISMGKWYKCVFADERDYTCFREKYGLKGDVCLLGAPKDIYDNPCYTYAYLNAMPPLSDTGGVEIKRLAPSLAQTVLDAYHNGESGYTLEHMESLMREKGVFGAMADGKLAGFIGRHGDGSMGMLEVFPAFRRRGIAAMLEKFLITYVMTFGRVPKCDVYTDNVASMALQGKLGLTKGYGYTYWVDEDDENKE
ncbi:MAG: GNAT family N-acetyltransferase [Clostridiales bacterium]|nr:GNAT family N-acetyltransferase [Clostridiales bacterium]